MSSQQLSRSTDRRRPAGAEVYAVLQENIVKGRYPPRAQLSEKRLAEELGVSRTPVREALIKLAEEGLVNIVPQSGTYVSPIDLAAFYDSQLIREALECATVFEAARRATPDEVAELRRIVGEQQRRLNAGDHEGFVAVDDRLHARLIEISGHAGVARIVQGAKLHLDRVRYLAGEDSLHISYVIGQHEEIVDRVAEHDARGARRAMREHLRLVFEKVDKLAWDQKAIFTQVPRRAGRRTRRLIVGDAAAAAAAVQAAATAADD